MDNLSGQIIKGYELRERIGAGGFGAVYRAFQTTVGREVAIKIILPGFANHPDFIRRFEAEAQTIARLEHLHIVPLYDYWRDPDGAYLVMRWLKGGSLRDALKTNGPYDVEHTSLLLNQIASALATAHQHHIIHRDLKPGNVLLDEDGNAYLADFGIAKDLMSLKESATQSDVIVGSPDYLSPEQARSETVTPQTDIYSLGVVLYELLSGQHPFPNGSTVQRLYSHLNDPLPAIAKLPDDIRDAVNAVIQKATMKNPAHRYTDAPAMAAAFRAAIALDNKETPTNVVEVLTPREQEILHYMVEGRTNKEIADQLFVTVATVKWYITQMYRKLGVRSRVQAIVRARELDLIARGFRSTQEDAATYVPSDQFQPTNPYKGLLPFQTADYHDFFGREKLVEKLVRRMAEPDADARFVAVIGPSGSGKSSLVRAGLIPALWRGDLPGSERWFVVELLPGARPLDELEVALTRVATIPGVNLREHLARDRYGLLRAANLVLPNDGSELVLVIDQFEEVFTLLDDEDARVHFLNLLHAAVTEPRSRVRVVITLRADFYDRPLHYPEFGELVRSHMETILPLSAQGLERAIAGPAERVGLTFEDGLVAQIIDEMHYQTGALPLLQYALTELFERRQGRQLTHAAYQDLGGAIGALAKRAEDLYREFSPAGQETIRQMFLRLVTLGEGTEDTRRRVHRSELLAIADDQEMMDEAIDTFVVYRLLSLDHDPATRSPTVEVAHEAILREWERLRLWLDHSRDEIRLQRLFSRAAQEWAAASRDASFLLSGTRLDQFQAWAGQTQLAFTPLETDYLRASATAREEAQAAALAQQAREIHLEQRARNVLRGLVAVFLVAAVVASGLAALAFEQRHMAQDNEAKANRNAELSQSLALASAARAALSEGNTDQALALAVAANQINEPPAFAQRTLYDASAAPGTIRRIPCATAWCWGMSVSPDEETVLTGDGVGGIVLSDLATGATIRRYEGGHTEEAVAFFLPDGKRFLSTGYDDKMLLWDVASGQILRTYLSTDGDFNGGALSPDGSFAATGMEAGVVLIWEVETGELLHRLVGHDPSVQVQGVAFSPDGKTLLSGSEDATMILWDVQTGELIRRFEGHTNIVFSVHFSPDGRNALSTSFDNTMILWNIATGQMIRQFAGHTNWVFDARFSPDGQQILSASRDQTLRLWDMASGNVLHTYAGEPSMALRVEYLSSGTQALSSYNDGILRVWQLTAQEVVRQFGAQAPPVPETDDTFADGDTLTLSKNGRWAAAPGAGADANAVMLWDTETGELIRRFSRHDGNVTSIAFSPDQRQLVSAAWDNTLILWDVQTGEEIRRFTGHTGPVLDVAFSPDGSRLASGSEDQTIILWDAAAASVLWRFDGFTDAVNSVAFSPDGHTLIAGFGTIRYVAGSNEDNSLRLFDVDTGEEMRRFEGHTAPITVARFSRDGKSLLSASTDATLRLWDVATGSEIRRLIGHGTAIWSADFSSDGRYAISGSQDGTVIVWDLTTGEELRSLDEPGAMVQGALFTPDGSMGLTASADGRLRRWRLTLGFNDLLTWVGEHRYVRDLACSERELYRVLPLCTGEQVESTGAI
ncbi:MAG TPA: protein kinase [Aggregatilineaceae bacterium]|nr:protein kinase [Aggregatilineaceae bacterium]